MYGLMFDSMMGTQPVAIIFVAALLKNTVVIVKKD
jgi:hypothetical protein